jgi:hypothetical protein
MALTISKLKKTNIRLRTYIKALQQDYAGLAELFGAEKDMTDTAIKLAGEVTTLRETLHRVVTERENYKELYNRQAAANVANVYARSNQGVRRTTGQLFGLSSSPTEFVWTTRLGERIKPSDMEEGHLRNTISFLARSIVAEVGKVRYLGSLEYQFRAMSEMLKEAERRGLQV